MGKGLTESIRVCYILIMRIKNKPDGQNHPTFTGAARRTQIIECAIETLATLGYAQASLAHIAKRAGISKGVIVYYFSSKGKLRSVLLKESSILDAIEAILRKGQQDGEFRAFDLRVMAITIRQAIDVVPRLLAANPNLDVEAYARELVTLFDRATALSIAPH